MDLSKNQVRPITYGSLVANRKVYPLDAPGMPLPGPDFIEKSKHLGDEDIVVEGKTANTKRLTNYGRWLSFLYAEALYGNDFQLTVDFKNTSRNVRFIPGHTWEGEDFGPLRQAKVMVIGKLPGNDERKNGRNLVGPSGQELIESLEELGEFGWRQWYITNLVKFPHPEPFAGGALPADWIKDCLPLLQQELRLVRPKFILCLGVDAIRWLMGKSTTIASSTGEVFTLKIPLHKSTTEEPVFHEAKVMVCTHPAAVLRSPDMHPQFFMGLRSFIDLINGTDPNTQETDIEHHFVSDEKTLDTLITKIKSDPSNANIAWDSEWHGDRPEEKGAYLRTIQFSWQPKKACCVILRHAGGKTAFKPGIDAAIKQLNRLTEPASNWPIRVIGHFFRADLPWLLHAGMKNIDELYNAPEDDNMSLPNAKYGWEKTKYEGGFDTGLAAHAHTEAGASYKLEVLANQYLGLRRYDKELQQWKVSYCKANGLKADDLEGYGECPEEILHPYSSYDADSTRRLFQLYNDDLLDRDRYGNNCREAFWIGQRASLAVLEMERNGMLLDRQRAEEMMRLYQTAKAELVQKIREDTKWPDFNPNSSTQCRELLFGEGFSGVLDSETKRIKRLSPEGAILSRLTPVKTTGKRPKTWEDVVNRGEQYKYQPCADKEVLGILSAESETAKLLRNIRFVDQLLKTNLRPPKTNKDDEELRDEDGELIYDKGLISYAAHDGRVRTHLFQTKETGRFSSARPNCQSLSKRREDDYKKILGAKYKAPLRSIFVAKPGHVFIEADYSGAELYGVAIMSRCKQMVEHCQRGTLKESDPNYYDIHSNIAVKAFKLTCLPTKKGLESIGRKALRIAAKTVVFGLLYGRGPTAIARAAKEEGVSITPAQAQQLIDQFFDLYPEVQGFMEACKERVLREGYVINSFGRIRRFRWSGDRQVIGEMERQCMNFPKIELGK